MLTNPKNRDNLYGKADWYPYYAGYAQGFVSDVIDLLNVDSTQNILDPWNGSGTTTHISSIKGIKAYGYDLNPAMVTVAKAKILSGVSYEYLIELAERIIKETTSSQKHFSTSTDPLSNWLRHDSIYQFRKLEFHILKHTLQEPSNIKGSKLNAFFQVILFRTLKNLLSMFRSSNPTWIKKAKTDAERVSINRYKIYNSFLREAQSMASTFKDNCNFQSIVEPIIGISNSQALPLPNDFIYHIITSPPYCTRIDYVVATLPELSILNPQIKDFNKLRRNMLGTNLIQKDYIIYDSSWGNTCKDFLESVKNHQSKASSGYYLKTFLQYFNSLHKSLNELNRVLKNNGTCTIVVQDSYYKDIHLDLPSIIVEMTSSFGWRCVHKEDFDNTVTMSNLNGNSKIYRKITLPIETALIFRKDRI